MRFVIEAILMIGTAIGAYKIGVISGWHQHMGFMRKVEKETFASIVDIAGELGIPVTVLDPNRSIQDSLPGELIERIEESRNHPEELVERPARTEKEN